MSPRPALESCVNRQRFPIRKRSESRSMGVLFVSGCSSAARMNAVAYWRMASSECFSFFRDFAEGQRGLRVREQAEAGGEILYRVVILVQVMLPSAAQHVEVHHEFVAAGLPVVQRHLLGARFRIGFGDAVDQARIVIDGVDLARVVGHFFKHRHGKIHGLAVFRLDGDDFLGIIERAFVIVRLHFGFAGGRGKSRRAAGNPDTSPDKLPDS